MRILWSVILTLTLCVSCAQARVLKFAQITDVHTALENKNNSTRDLLNSVKNLENAVQQINKDKSIKFVVFTGDVINSSRDDELDEFLKTASKLNKPYYIVMGNHDVHSIGGLSKEYFMEKVSEQNPNQTSKPNFSFSPAKGILFIGLDSAPTRFPSTHGYVTENTALWLDKTLNKNKNKKAFIFQHQPFLPPLTEENHSMLEPEVYEKVLDKHNNIEAIIAGHYHEDRVETDKRGIKHIVSSALVEKPSSYRVIEIDYNKKGFSQPKINEIKAKNHLVK